MSVQRGLTWFIHGCSCVAVAELVLYGDGWMSAVCCRCISLAAEWFDSVRGYR